jgi:hypothetical protein
MEALPAGKAFPPPLTPPHEGEGSGRASPLWRCTTAGYPWPASCGQVAGAAQTGIIPASNTARNPDILGCGFMGAGMKDSGFGAGWHAGPALIGVLSGLALGVMFGMWFGPDVIKAPEACEGSAAWCFLYTWQTLLTGLIALLVGIVSVHSVKVSSDNQINNINKNIAMSEIDDLEQFLNDLNFLLNRLMKQWGDIVNLHSFFFSGNLCPNSESVGQLFELMRKTVLHELPQEGARFDRMSFKLRYLLRAYNYISREREKMRLDVQKKYCDLDAFIGPLKRGSLQELSFKFVIDAYDLQGIINELGCEFKFCLNEGELKLKRLRREVEEMTN